MRSTLFSIALLHTLTAAGALASPFATRIVDFQPAPGQFAQNPIYNDPARALGAPVGGGLSAPDNTKLVSIGGFGGSLTLGFDHAIGSNPHNPFGIDCIIYGNGFFVGGNPLIRHGECGVIEIARDDNNNGLADDAWYLIPGSHLPTGLALSRTIKNWNAATLNPLWVPPLRSGSWSTTTYLLTGVPFTASPMLSNPDPVNELVRGYADSMPTLHLGDTNADDSVEDASIDPALFYTSPDDPTKVGVTPGSGGGAGFGIAWAINASTGLPPSPPLDRFDFIRISTAVDLISGPLGEVSTEIGAVADARPVYTADWNFDGSYSIQDLFDFLKDWFAGIGEAGGADFNDNGSTTVQDLFDFLEAWFAAN